MEDPLRWKKKKKKKPLTTNHKILYRNLKWNFATTSLFHTADVYHQHFYRKSFLIHEGMHIKTYLHKGRSWPGGDDTITAKGLPSRNQLYLNCNSHLFSTALLKQYWQGNFQCQNISIPLENEIMWNLHSRDTHGTRKSGPWMMSFFLSRDRIGRYGNY